jgi:transposase InsO family protein
MFLLNTHPANIRVAINDQKDNIFKRKKHVLLDKPTRWRKVAKMLNFDRDEHSRLEWIIFYYTVGRANASATAKYFGISRQCLHKWLKRFQSSQEKVHSLKTLSRAPDRVRSWRVTKEEERKIKVLRKEFIHYGKLKLAVLYKRRYGKLISAHKIQRVINKWQLYPDQIKKEKIDNKRKSSKNKKRIQSLVKKDRPWFLVQLDGITIYRNGGKRYILTAVDRYSKVAYARMYKSKSSHHAADFLYRLLYLANYQIKNVQTDNGSEFAGEFNQAIEKRGLEQYFSRSYTPTDNAEIEKLNGTLKHEWLKWGNLTMEADIFNKRLLNWIFEYNYVRPHQTLDYLTPMKYLSRNMKVSTMYPSSTFPCFFPFLVLVYS